MVIIPISLGGYRGIGLIEVICNVCASIVKNRLQSTTILHDVLHRFRQGRGTGTAIMEENMEHQLAGVIHEPLFQVFIDVQKAYKYLDRGTCMEILRMYVLGHKLQRLLQRYWDGQKLVSKEGKFLGILSTRREE